MDILKAINEEKKAKKVTGKELAIACGVSEVQMSKYLRGENKLPFEVAQTCASHLGLTLLLGKIIK